MNQMDYIFIVSSFLLVIVYLTIIARFKKNQNHLSTLTQEYALQSSELSDFKNKQNNPLGPLLNDVKNSIILEVDKTGKILNTDINFQKLLGYSKRELIGKDIHGFLIESPSSKDPLKTSLIQRLFQSPKLFTEFETEMTTKRKEKIWISWTNKIVYNNQKKPIKAYCVGFNITKRKNLEADLQFMASIDPQTDVLNRQAFLQTGMRELRRTIRYKHPLSVLLIQLKLKNNISLSIEKRNDILKQIILKCKKTIRDVDYLGRIGEVEFAFLLPETNITNINFLQKRLEKELKSEQENLHLTNVLDINYAASSYTQKEKSIDEIIMNAYKKLNKNQRKTNGD